MTTIHEQLALVKAARQSYNELIQDTSVLWSDLLFKFIEEKVKDIPNFLRLQWIQYTPHFNDGDACEFSVCDPEIFLLDPDEDASDGYEDLEGIEGGYFEFKDLINAIYKVMNEDLMFATFKDGYTISYVKGATKFYITECQHD